MALVIGQDTFGTLQEASAYFAGRTQGTFWENLDSDVQTNALRMAAIHLSSMYVWRGRVSEKSDQQLPFPCEDLYDQFGRKVGPQVVPNPIKFAQFELAGQWALADQLMPLASHLTASDSKAGLSLKREKLGPLEKEYNENTVMMFSLAEGRMASKVYPLVDLYVRPFAFRRADAGQLRLTI